MQIKNNVFMYRISNNLTVNDLSKMTGLHHTTITNIENNNPQNVTLMSAWLIANALKVDVFDLFVIKR